MLIYVKRNDQVSGPYSLEQTRSYLASGNLDYTDLAQLEGTAEWITLATVPGITSLPPPPPPPSVQSPTTSPSVLGSEKSFKIRPVLRDVVIVWVLTGIGGSITSFATGGPDRDPVRFMLGVAASNVMLGIVAFTISGCLAIGNRWRHLAFVAFGSWVASIINVLFFGFGIGQWFGSVILFGIIMVIGGGISFLFKRK